MKYQEKEHDLCNWSCGILWINMVLSILIVFLHTNFESDDFCYITLKHYMNTLADCAVPCFFCISAYLTFRKYKLSLQNYKILLLKRMKTLIVPYILWNLIGYIYQSANEYLTTRQINILSVRKVFISAYNEPLWFIRTLYIFVIISPIIFFIARYKTLTIVLILIDIFLNLRNEINYTSILFWLPIYLIGAYSGLNCKESIEKEYTYSRFKQLCLLGGYIVLIVVVTECSNRNIYYIYRLISGLLIIRIFMAVKWKRMPISILQNSFFTFCSHVLLLGVLQKIFDVICINFSMEIFIAYILCSFSIWIVTIILAEIMKKHFSVIYSILSGNRKGKI